MVDFVRETRVQVSEGVVRQGGEVGDRIDAFEDLWTNVADVAFNRGHPGDPGWVSEGTPAVQIAVDTNDRMTVLEQQRHQPSADVPEVTSDQHPHRSTSF